VNPGSEGTFKWLSKMALLYEFYKFHYLEFHYETRSPSTGEGSIILSPDYDSADGAFAVTESSLFNNKGSVDTPVWVSKSCRLDSGSMNRLFKSHACMSDSRFATTTQDLKTLDVAQLFVMIDTTLQAAYKYGKLFVRYKIEFFNPQAPTELINLGGAGLYTTSASLAPSTTTPIVASSFWTGGLTNFKSDPNVLVQGGSLSGIAYPGAVVGRFAKDYNGILASRQNGTTISSSPAFYVGTDPLSAAGAGGDVAQTLIAGALNATATQVLNNYAITAKAGDYLKLATGAAATLTNLGFDLGGVSLANII
jgi:hypothetical protein